MLNQHGLSTTPSCRAAHIVACRELPHPPKPPVPTRYENWGGPLGNKFAQENLQRMAPAVCCVLILVVSPIPIWLIIISPSIPSFIKYKPFISSHHPWIMCQKPWKPSDLNVAPCHPKTFRNGVGIELVHDDIDPHRLLPLDQGFPGLPGQIRNSKPGMINQNISNHINMLWASTSIFCTSPCAQCVLHIYPCACIMCTHMYIYMYKKIYICKERDRDREIER